MHYDIDIYIFKKYVFSIENPLPISKGNKCEWYQRKKNDVNT